MRSELRQTESLGNQTKDRMTNRLQQAIVINLVLSVHVMWAQSSWPNYPNNASISVLRGNDKRIVAYVFGTDLGGKVANYRQAVRED